MQTVVIVNLLRKCKFFEKKIPCIKKNAERNINVNTGK